MRSTYRLRDLVTKYGRARVEAACVMAIEIATIDVVRLEKVIELGAVSAGDASRPARRRLPTKYAAFAAGSK